MALSESSSSVDDEEQGSDVDERLGYGSSQFDDDDSDGDIDDIDGYLVRETRGDESDGEWVVVANDHHHRSHRHSSPQHHHCHRRRHTSSPKRRENGDDRDPLSSSKDSRDRLREEFLRMQTSALANHSRLQEDGKHNNLHSAYENTPPPPPSHTRNLHAMLSYHTHRTHP